MASDIGVISNQLREAVLTTMNPNVDNAIRSQAFSILEEMKSRLELSVPCGFLLAKAEEAAVLRHYGLHLLESAIKYHWQNMNDSDKCFIKDNTMTLLKCGLKTINEEELFIKDKISRLMVELIKRLWPQLWPDLLQQLNECVSLGLTQTQIVMMILARLSEDVATLQTLDNGGRRKELYQALTSNMGDIFKWQLTLLEQHYNLYKSEASAGVSRAHTVVIQSILDSVSSYVEWAAAIHVFADDNKLVLILSFLLSDSNLRLNAAQCLLGIVTRKNSSSDRLHCLSLFHSDCLSAIHNAAEASFRHSPSLTDSLSQDYNLVKVLAQVMEQLMHQLTYLWGKELSVKVPQTFGQSIGVLSLLSQHPSLMVYSSALGAWNVLLKHTEASQTVELKQSVPPLLVSLLQKVVHHGYPSEKSDSSVYSVLDFEDSDEDYANYFSKTRTDMCICFKTVASLDPAFVFSHIEETQRTVTSLPPPLPSDDVTKTRPFRAWEAYSTILEWAMKTGLYNDSTHVSTSRSLSLLEALLPYSPQDERLLSLLFSCIKSFFPMIPLKPEVLEPVFNKVMAPLVADGSSNRSKTVRELRRHSCVLLLKLVKEHPNVLLPGFGFIVEMVNNLNSRPNSPSVGEKGLLLEALVILNRHRDNEDLRGTFLRTISMPVRTFLMEGEQSLQNPVSLASLMGLTEDPNALEKEECITIRREVSFSFLLVEILAKYSTAETNCFPIIKELLNPLFGLVRSLNALQKASVEIHPGYREVFSLPGVEKKALMGIKEAESPDEKSKLEQMQIYFNLLHEKWISAFSYFPSCDSFAFYSLPNLNSLTLEAPLFALDLHQDHRLRSLIKNLAKSWLGKCPENMWTVYLKPVFRLFTGFINDHLERRWLKVASVEVTEDEDTQQDTKVMEEVLEAVIVRNLTRDSIDLIKSLFFHCPPGQSLQSDALEVSPMGLFLLSSQDSLSPVMALLLKCLSWGDSCSCVKATHLLPLLVKNISSLLSREDACGILSSLLSALNKHGHHPEVQQTLLNSSVIVYSLLRPLHDTSQLLMSVPNATEANVKKLDELVAQSIASAVKNSKLEKQKKDLLKKILQPIIGVSISEVMKEKVQLGVLPPLFTHRKYTSPPLEEREGDIGLTNLFH